jgi:hypothetical protein
MNEAYRARIIACRADGRGGGDAWSGVVLESRSSFHVPSNLRHEGRIEHPISSRHSAISPIPTGLQLLQTAWRMPVSA